jgi:hypothetical protein
MTKTTAAVATIAALVMGSSAFATIDIMKEYKKAKDPKATCASCHVAQKPKKGAAELNDLGKKVAGAKKGGKIDWSKIPAVEQK